MRFLSIEDAFDFESFSFEDILFADGVDVIFLNPESVRVLIFFVRKVIRLHLNIN